jgi:microcystin-dependent protein
LADPYIGELRIFAGNFAPSGWLLCAGQLLSISEHEALFQLIGTTYGGDGETTFAIPDLRGRLLVHQGNGFVLAETGGVEQVTLTTSQLPAHTHAVLASSAAGGPNPQGAVPATSAAIDLYRESTPDTPLGPSLAAVGGSQPHTNLQPALCVNYIISLFGIFPSPT